MDGGIKVETCILPLINSSIYNQVKDLMGGAPVEFSKSNSIKGDIFSLTLKLNIDKKLNSMLSNIVFGGSGSGEVSIKDITKGEVQFHMSDTNPLVDFDGSRLTEVLMRGRIRRSDVFFGIMAWSLFHPIRIAVPLKDKKLATRLLDRIGYYFANGQFSRYMNVTNYTYRHNGLDIKVSKISIMGTISFRIYYTIDKNNVLQITSTEKYMKNLLDENNRLNPGVSNKGNIVAEYRPKQMVQEKDIFKANIMESTQKTSFKNFPTIVLMKKIFKDDKSIQNKIFEYYSFKPVCPMGGKYRFDKKGYIYNTVFGSRYKPVIDYKKVSSDMFDRYFSTESIKLQLEFTKEGIKTEIRTK